jgi:hypothetical protein
MRAVLIALLLCAAPAVFAQNVPPTEQSVRRVLDLTQQHRIIDDAVSNMDAYLKQTLDQASKGRPLNAKQQQIVDQYRTDIVTIMKDELSWQKLEPSVVAIYEKTFSQKEIDDMIAFYSSPSGQAVANKLPLVSQEMTTGMQKRMVPIIERMQQTGRDMAVKLKAAEDEPAQPAAH